MTDEAVAFVPGHVTGFFSAHPDPDPRAAGSRGAGLTLTDGVRVTAVPGETGVRLGDEAAEMAPVETVLDSFDGQAGVVVESDLPPGAGFGVSGAAALGAALATNAVLDAGCSENELVGRAHAAEVEAGTGLGDVVAQARGRLPVRLDPGGPEHGRLDGVPVPAETRVEYVVFGDVSTAAVIGGDTERLTRAGEAALADLRERPTVERFLALSRRFASEADLLTDRAAEAVRDVEATGGQASMAMLGDAAFAVGTGLSDAGYDPSVCRVHPAGATLVGADGRDDRGTDRD